MQSLTCLYGFHRASSKSSSVNKTLGTTSFPNEFHKDETIDDEKLWVKGWFFKCLCLNAFDELQYNRCSLCALTIHIYIFHLMSAITWANTLSSTVHTCVFPQPFQRWKPQTIYKLRDLKMKPCNFPWFNWDIYIWCIYILIKSSVPQPSHWLTLSLDDILWTHYERRDANGWHGPCSMNIRWSQLVSDTAFE